MSTALGHVEDEIGGFVAKYENCGDSLATILQNFIDTRIKDTGIRKLANWAQSFNYLLEALPDGEMKHTETIYSRLLELGTALSTTNKTMLSHVENTVVRGWPMFLNPNNKYLTYEGMMDDEYVYASYPRSIHDDLNIVDAACKSTLAMLASRATIICIEMLGVPPHQ